LPRKKLGIYRSLLASTKFVESWKDKISRCIFL